MVRKDSAVLEPEQALIFAKKLLCNKVFLGHYQERRYVDSLKSYRDVVLIDEGESDLKSQLDIVKQHMAIYCGTSISWIGITGPDVIGAPNGYAVWVKLHEMPFGKYWFQIKNIKISQSCEVVISLKRVSWCLGAVGGLGVCEDKKQEICLLTMVGDQCLSVKPFGMRQGSSRHCRSTIYT
ncbi:uncharacterized protein LOC126248577 isoform X2 [Schistocerca nitens]|uniref:uncharacterized protein LOC126248577 isoform X2 n=1 Tax=Schistocerca nitens TaxID=7011 RepID=UPI00211855B1|nr:uncharacterized protein LOC126248577 isoform X2 [Schistocerca nitens]